MEKMVPLAQRSDERGELAYAILIGLFKVGGGYRAMGE
jgi:hypothetical protein